MRVLSLFSGIGAFEVALDELGIEWELDHYCEIDKFACQSYNQIHGTTDADNLKDVTDIDYDKIGNIDLLTYGFPCQDISLAGKQKGFHDDEGNLTRSGLFFNAVDVIEKTRPKFAIFENVKNLTGKNMKKEFETVLSTLDELGYNTYWKVLNAKDYGIPQNRERVFGISIRKDIDKGYMFPEKQELKLRLKDMLENDVDEKYYLSDTCLKGFLKHNENHKAKGTGFIFKPKTKDDIASCITARVFKHGATDNSILEPNDIAKTVRTGGRGSLDRHSWDIILEPKVEQVGNIVNTGNWDNPQRGRIYSAEGLSPTLNCMQGGGLEPKIVEINEPFIVASRGINPENPSDRTLQAAMGSGGGNIPLTYTDFRIRKLTPRECWRLMGFKDEYFDRVKGVSNTQLYKQAGNSIVVDVLKAIFTELQKQYPEHFKTDLWSEEL